MENGPYMRMSKEDIGHMNGASGKKLTHDTLQGPESVEILRCNINKEGRRQHYRKGSELS
eukprot:6211777-Pleurochrysis_carterae.AAC.6